VVHELGTPLAIIQLKTEQLRMELGKNEDFESKFDREKIKKSVENIEAAGERISEVVGRLRSFVRESHQEASSAVKLLSVVQQAVELSHEKFKYDQVQFTNEVPAVYELKGHSADLCYLFFSIFVKGLEHRASAPADASTVALAAPSAAALAVPSAVAPSAASEKKLCVSACENPEGLEIKVTAFGFHSQNSDSPHLRVADMICRNYGASLRHSDEAGCAVWTVFFPHSVVESSDIPAVA
jgi:hypothetical protein